MTRGTYKILGVHDGHTATAALLDDGIIKACVSEERLNRIKEWYGFPRESVKKVLELTNTDPMDINLVVIPGLIKPIDIEQFIGKKRSMKTSAFHIFKTITPNFLLKQNSWVKPAVRVLSKFRNKAEIYSFFENMGIPRKKVIFVDHHTCHAYSTLLNWWGQIDDALILTLDGAGDGFCSTVNISENGNLKTIERTNLFNSIGWLYARTTQYLGMKPASHEYKVMGLAAYGKEEYYKHVYKTLRQDFFRLNPKNQLTFENLSGCWGIDYFKKFQNKFGMERFDNIAAGVQRFTEDIVLEWVQRCVEETGARNVFCSGGVFMNVKMNMKILYALKELDKFFVYPSCGDESNAIGAAVYGYYYLCKQDGKKFNPSQLKDIYWGPEYTNDDVDNILKKERSWIKYDYINDIEGYIAENIINGKIIARMNSRMEFGARALGNRSILADPSNYSVIRRINDAIKFRDFWMPFAPTILKERSKDYLIIPKNINAPYMIFAFESTDLAKKDLISGIHNYDLTCRPQILEKEWNPLYYKLIKAFESETGIGGILNTSFNIHGDPIVCSPVDALDTFKRSKLDAVAVGNYYITKK